MVEASCELARKLRLEKSYCAFGKKLYLCIISI